VTSPTTNKEPLKKDSPEVEEPKKKNNFFRSTYDELKLVEWPNKQQLFSESVAVIIMVSFSAADDEDVDTKNSLYVTIVIKKFKKGKKMIEPLLCGIVLGLVPITLLGLFVSAWNQYRRGSGILDID